MYEKAVIFALVLGLFAAVWRIESGWRIVFTPFLLAMYWELTRIFPAFFLAESYAGIGSEYALRVAVAGFVTLLTGFVAWYCFPRADTGRVLALSRCRTALMLDGYDSASVLMLGLALACLGLVFFGGLPATVQSMFSLITSGGDAELARFVSEQRLALTKGAYFGAEYRGQGLISEIQQVGWALICCYVLLRHMELRTRTSLAIVIGAVLGAWVFVGGFGSRAPLLNILICMVAAYSLRRAIPLRTMVIVILAGIAVAVALGLYSSKMYFLLAGALGIGDFLSQALLAVIERTLLGNGLNDVYAIEFVRTGALEVGYGAHHARDVLAAMPGTDAGLPLAYELYRLINESATGTTFNTGTYLSKVFVDFYWPGVVVVFFLVGVALAMTQQWLFRVAGNPWSIATAVVVSFAVVGILRGGPVSFCSTMAVVGILWVFQRLVRSLLRGLAGASEGTGTEAQGRLSHG